MVRSLLISVALLLLGASCISLSGSQTTAQAGACAVTVAPGDDIGRAVAAAPAGGTVCLAAGTHRAAAISLAKPGVTLRGSGADATVIAADQRDGADITGVARFTLADVTVRGGSPSGIYATRTPGLVLRGVRIEGAATGLHVEGPADLDLTDVTISGASEWGLLLRRGARLSGQGLHVVEFTGRGVGAVDSPGSLTLRDSEVSRAAGAPRAGGDSMLLNGWERFSLVNVSVRGGAPAGIYLAKAKEATLQGVRVEGAQFGVHVDENAVVALDDVAISASTGVGLLLQRGGAVTGRGVQVLDTAGTGVSAINGPGPLTLRDSEIARVAAAGLFAGVAGCADLPPASLEVPECFYRDLQGQVSTARVLLENVRLAETRGPCLVFFPGVRAEVRGSVLTRCELTGLFAWGATADVSGTTFDDNAEHALEYRAFPDPRADVLLAASGTIQDSVIQRTRPLEGAILGAAGPGPVLGGGMLAQGARLVLQRNEVRGNRDIGIAFVNRSSGEVSDNRILDNGNTGLCVLVGNSVTARDNVLSGNRSDDPNACGGLGRG